MYLLILFIVLFLSYYFNKHTVTSGGVVFLYPGKGFLRDPSLSVPPKPSVVAVSSRNRTAVGRTPFYPFYNGMRPPSFPRANDSSRRYGGKGIILNPFAPYECLAFLLSASFFLASLSLFLSFSSFSNLWDQSSPVSQTWAAGRCPEAAGPTHQCTFANALLPVPV